MNELTPRKSTFRNILDHQKDTLNYFNIAWTLAGRELKGRYRGSWLGFLWTFVDPLMMMAIFSFIFMVVFSRRDYPHYLLYLMSGMLPFFYFNNSLIKATNSMLTYSPLIRQIYCPREIFVLSCVLSELYHFSLGLIALIPLYIYYGIAPHWKAFLIIPNTLLLTVFVLGLSLLFSSLNVFIRDVAYLISHLLRMWFYLTPVFYPLAQFSVKHKGLLFIYQLNPLVTILQIYRWALMPNDPFPQPMFVGILLAEIVIVFAIGLIFFRWQDNAMVKML